MLLLELPCLTRTLPDEPIHFFMAKANKVWLFLLLASEDIIVRSCSNLLRFSSPLTYAHDANENAFCVTCGSQNRVETFLSVQST